MICVCVCVCVCKYVCNSFFHLLQELLMDTTRRPRAAGGTVKPWLGGSRGLPGPCPPRHMDRPPAAAAPTGAVGAAGGRTVRPTWGGNSCSSWGSPTVTMTVVQVSVVLIASLNVVLSALLTVCANTGGTGMTARGRERARAPGKPKAQARKGRGGSGKGETSLDALFSVRTERGSRGRTEQRGQNTGGAKSQLAKHGEEQETVG